MLDGDIFVSLALSFPISLSLSLILHSNTSSYVSDRGLPEDPDARPMLLSSVRRPLESAS